MPRARGHILQRRRFLVACEGDSEFGYAALLQRLADDSGLAIHLDPRRCHGGDPLAIVEAAVSELHFRSTRRGAYAGQAIFLDADRRDDVPERTTLADQLILEHGFHVNRLCTWLRFDQHAVGKGFCIGGEAEERAESSVAGFAAVEAKDELIEIGLQMLATQPVVDASRPSFEVGEDLVDPRQDEVSGGLPDDMDIVAIGGDRSVAGPAVGFRDGVGIGGGFRRSVRGRRRRRRRFRPAAGGLGCFRPRVRWRRR